MSAPDTPAPASSTRAPLHSRVGEVTERISARSREGRGRYLERIAAEGDNADVEALKGWRRELFGETALKLIKGDVALRFVDRKIEAVEL